eukprot:2365089-Ditylum_brightwellii.AAC.1
MEVQGLLQHLPDGKTGDPETNHVVIPLLGEFKGERGERWHLLLLADVTSSGFKPHIWTERVAAKLKVEGRTSGPVMCDEEGKCMLSLHVEDIFHQQLERVQTSHPRLIDASADVAELYGISRSPQRGSLSRATDQGINKESRDLQNR